MEQRRMGRIGRSASVLVYGAAALSQVSQETADASIEEALALGIDSFDVAASYGEAELRLAPWTARFAVDGVYLATKTEQRGAEGAWTEINRSLERLGVGRVDLIQLHAVGDLADLDRATGPGGALEAATRARDEGLVGAVGITGHGHEAPATHLEALRRFPFEAVLTPWNFVLAQRPDYRADFEALVAECARQDVALRTIKTVARRTWPGAGGTADQTYATWYEPWDDPGHLDACVAFALRQPGVCGIPAAGDVRLLGRILAAVERAPGLSDADVERVLSRAPGYASPFVTTPS